MTVPLIGEKVKVSYADKSGFRYVLRVEVLSVAERDHFVGRVESVFAEGNGEITRGKVLDVFKGKEISFSSAELVAEPCGRERPRQ